MCRRREIELFDTVDMRWLSFGKSKYPVGIKSLPGCVNDAMALTGMWGNHFDGDIRTYINGDVTVKKYKQRVTDAIASLLPDPIVTIIADSCHSESITKGNWDLKARYYPNKRLKPLPHIGRIYKPTEMKWLVISGSEEDKPSYDAYFTDIGTHMGALSYSLWRTYRKDMTWGEWFESAKELVKQLKIPQTPTVEGPEWMKNEVIGARQTLIVHNSSHGSQVVDTSGDEEDGLDETLYFDTHLLDDEINVILSRIPMSKELIKFG